MKIKLAHYLSDFMVDAGITQVFTVTGGGAMHLNDALGHNSRIHSVYNHHEQACAIAAEGYARVTNKPALVCVTSGPGGTNALTGVLGAWQDSFPLFVVSGQVKRETTTWATDVPVRQLGDQEFQIVDCAKTMTKYAVMVTDPNDIRYHLEKALYLMLHGRKGPVWLDIPLDVQAAPIDPSELKGFNPSELEQAETPVYDKTYTPLILEKLVQAKRPVILAGTGVRLSGAYKEFRELIEKLHIPVLTAWNSNDLLPDEHPLFAGRPATVGTRAGNFIAQAADVMLVLGSRLNIRLISYNRKQFAQQAYKIMVDIDEAELRKPTISPDLAIHADVADVIRALNIREVQEALETGENRDGHVKWANWAHTLNKRFPAVLPEYRKNDTPINPYVFVEQLSYALEPGEIIACGNGSACVVTFQAFHFKENQRMFTNSGCAAMGYGFPAALGACLADSSKRVICIDGDGSFMMNLQELQTVVYNRLNLKIFILNNNGYHSIRQTQKSKFEPPFVGVSADSGISFPDFSKIAFAFGLPYVSIYSQKEIDAQVMRTLEEEGPIICEVFVDQNQDFEPKLSSKVMPDGSIVSPSLDDMFPFLPRETYEEVKHLKGLDS